ncbi:Dod COI i3 grp IB protein, partial [Zychaea mexicana]|uniref:Dod COI i3 grp IB protein n=1 Tax=Zychaea mexicana TaxID=64656 RepID=UPI0022FDBB7A
YSTNNVNQNDNQLGYYLAGLIEGDGSIIVPTKKRTDKGRLTHPVIRIVFSLSDLPLAEKLQQVLGCGFIQKPKKGNYVLYEIQNQAGLLKLTNLIYGKIRTPKIEALNRLIDWLNNKNVNGNIFEYSELDLNTSPIINNAWLSGFIDADGSFDVKVREKSYNGKGKNRVETRLRIEQRITDPSTELSYYSVMKSIAKLNTSLHNEGIEYYTVSATSPAKLKTLINYLDTYPLFSSKLLNYLDFKFCVNLMLSRKHLTEQGRDNIKIIKAGMNRKRTYYNWDHLEKLSEY